MKAVLWTKYGPAEELQIGEMPKPVPGPDDLLVRVHATTATLGDCEMRALALPAVFRIPIRLYLGVSAPAGHTLGQEFAGVVKDTGSGVTRFKPGDAVLGQTGVSMGAYAQYLAIKQSALVTAKPANVSFAQAACLPLGGMEAQYLVDKADLPPDSRVLVIGAGGSIGTMAIQLLKLRGAHVTAVDTAEKFGVMRAAGADDTVDYRETDYLHTDAVYDGIFDVVGKTPLRAGLNRLRSGGAYMHANPKVWQMIVRRLLAGRSKRLLIKTGEPTPADLARLAALLEAGKINPLIDKILPLTDVVAAHQYIEAGHKKGNLVLEVE